MAISEKARQALQEKLDEVLGPQDAWALMEEVSGRDWGQLATKVDLDHHAALTKRDIEGLEGRMDARFEGLEGRMDARFEAVEERIVRVEGVLSAKIDGLGHRLEGMLGQELGKVYKELAAHTRTTVFACIAAVMTSAGVALASTRL
ncbi:MAG TPA: hypothetical protein VM142_15820 [Acidimicrobiales bacterium]|nr:hypothetical protein [Acidimicrobiales bacterium]